MTIDSVVASEKLFTTAQQEYKLLAEYKMLQSEDIAGIYVIPSAESSFLWFGVVFVRDGMYKDGIFRFNISIPENFPDNNKPPKIIFQNEIFHPMICPFTGNFELSNAFQIWQNRENHIWQLLKYMQYIFKYPQNLTSSSKVLNKNAADLLSQNKAEYLLKIKENVRISRDKIYDSPPTDDKHYITFERFDKDLHGPALDKMKTNTDSSISPQNSGISWVKEGEFKPLGNNE